MPATIDADDHPAIHIPAMDHDGNPEPDDEP
jgi:hypothetical protein